MEHSEGNHSQTEPMRFIQMWIIPTQRGLEPSIEQREFREDVRRGRWLAVLVPAPGYGGRDAPTNPDAVTVHQDATLYATLLEPGATLEHRFRDGFNGYLFVVHGEADVSAGDGGAGSGGPIDEAGAAKIVGEPAFAVQAGHRGAELLLVETRAIDRSAG
jgi:redox-sensitive bicupin YhaK (pirin superfamily)